MTAARPWSIPASAMPVIATLAYLFWKGAEINWFHGAAAMIGMIFFHLAGNTWSNNVEQKNAEKTENTVGTKWLSIALCAAGLACCAYLIAMTGTTLLWIALAGAAFTLVYPWMRYTIFGDLDIIVTFAILPAIATSFAAVGNIDWSVLIIAIPVGLITAGIQHSRNARILIAGNKTALTAVSLGTNVSARLFWTEMVFPFVWVGISSMLGFMPLYTVLIFLTIAIALACGTTMIKSVGQGTLLLSDLDVRTANLQRTFSTLLTIGLILGKFL
jgi:1,4-dihydroxy-2-naphthoate octaprenyltransferase